MMNKKTKGELKIIIIGKYNTGKTSFCRMWLKNEFQDEYKATINTDFNYKIEEYKGNYYKTQIWDIGGQDRYITMTKVLSKNSHGCIIFSDITDKRSLDDTLKWKKSIDENARFKDGSFLPCVLVQNKIDLVSEDDVKNDASFKNFAMKNNFVKCFRTSVKKNIGVKETMDFLIGFIIDKLNSIKKKNEEIKKKKMEENKSNENKDNEINNEENIDDDENNSKQIVLRQKFEKTKENTLKMLNDSNCCANLNKLNLEKLNKEKENNNSDNVKEENNNNKVNKEKEIKEDDKKEN